MESFCCTPETTQHCKRTLCQFKKKEKNSFGVVIPSPLPGEMFLPFFVVLWKMCAFSPVVKNLK